VDGDRAAAAARDGFAQLERAHRKFSEFLSIGRFSSVGKFCFVAQHDIIASIFFCKISQIK